MESGNAIWLKKLSEKKLIDLYLPIVVKNELLSQRIEKIQEETTQSLEKFSKDIQKFNHSELKKLFHKVSKIVSDIEKDNRKNAEEFLNSDLFNEIEFNSQDQSNVFEKYFTGAGVFFNRLKNRKDLPDAFIYESIKSISDQSSENLFIVCKDGPLKDAVANNLNLKVFASIKSLLNDCDVIKKIKEKFETTESFESEKSVIQSAISIDLFISHVEGGGVAESLQDKLYNEKVYEDDHYQYESDHLVIEDVNSIEPIERIEHMEYYGEGEGILEFKTQANVMLEHFVHISDIHFYNDLSNIELEIWNDYMYRVVEPGTVSIEFSSEFEVDYEKLEQAVKEEWKGKKLGRLLGSGVFHQIKVHTISFIGFDKNESYALSEDPEDENYQNQCQKCGAAIGTCEH